MPFILVYDKETLSLLSVFDHCLKLYHINFMGNDCFLLVALVAVQFTVVVKICVVGSPGTPNTGGR